MNETRKRRRRREPKVEPRPPVLVVSCPQCGGSVSDADLGERTKCQYCGTDLHLPTVDFTPDAPESEPPRVVKVERAEPELLARRAKNDAAFGWFMGVLAAAAIAAIVLVMSSSPTSDQIAAPAPQSPRDKEVEATISNANCNVDCTKSCLNIENAGEMVSCFDKCNDKCKFVGKGTPSECRSRCSTSCAGAPDTASRAACESGCMQGCPPG